MGLGMLFFMIHVYIAQIYIQSIPSSFSDLLEHYSHLLVSISPNRQLPQARILQGALRLHSSVESRQSVIKYAALAPYANCAFVVHPEEHRD